MNDKRSIKPLRLAKFTFFTLLGLAPSLPLWADIIEVESIEILGSSFFSTSVSTNRFFYDDEPLALIGGFVTPSPDTDRQSTNPTSYGDGTTVAIYHEPTDTTLGIPYRGPITDPVASITGGSSSAHAFYGANYLSVFESDITLTSGWSLMASNPDIDGGATVSTAIRDLDLALTPGFVTNVAISGDPETPTLSWKQPDDNIHNAQSIFIWRTDLLDENGEIRPPVLVHLEKIDDEATGFSVPTNLNRGIEGDETLDPNGQYLLSIQLDAIDQEIFDAQVAAGETTVENYPLLGRSLSLFEFTPTAATPGGPPVFLPAVDEDGQFHFNIDVVNGETVYIDPFVSIGYDYEVGINDPLFASFILPEIGDDLFDLYLFDINVNDFIFDQVVGAGIDFFFSSPVSKFRILGIETGEALDPSDPNAFITGLTFAGSGTFTGTMTAITEFVPETVPEPGSLGLFLLGLSALGAWGRKTL